MASFAFTDCDFRVNSVNLSSFVTSVTLNISADELETTAMGTSGYRSRIGGLKDWSVSVEFNEDFAASAPDVTLFAILGTVVTMTVKATSAANSATNPQYSGSVLISQWNPFGNSVGDVAKASVTWPGAGALSRLTS